MSDDPAMNAACCRCGLPYGSAGFEDLLIPNEAWARISPSMDQYGLLCPNCMCARAAEVGVSCHARFVSGPFAQREYADAIAALEARMAELEAALREARNKALEEAATVCAGIEDECHLKWRKSMKCDPHMEGMSDGANDCAAAIRAMKNQQTGETE